MLPSPVHRRAPVPLTGRLGRLGRLLHLVVDNGKSLVLCQGVGSRIGAGRQRGALRQRLPGHGHKKRQIKALGAVTKRNNGNWGKLTSNLYETGTKCVQTLYEFRASFIVS